MTGGHFSSCALPSLAPSPSASFFAAFSKALFAPYHIRLDGHWGLRNIHPNAKLNAHIRCYVNLLYDCMLKCLSWNGLEGSRSRFSHRLIGKVQNQDATHRVAEHQNHGKVKGTVSDFEPKWLRGMWCSSNLSATQSKKRRMTTAEGWFYNSTAVHMPTKGVTNIFWNIPRWHTSTSRVISRGSNIIPEWSNDDPRIIPWWPQNDRKMTPSWFI